MSTDGATGDLQRKPQGIYRGNHRGVYRGSHMGSTEEITGESAQGATLLLKCECGLSIYYLLYCSRLHPMGWCHCSTPSRPVSRGVTGRTCSVFSFHRLSRDEKTKSDVKWPRILASTAGETHHSYLRQVQGSLNSLSLQFNPWHQRGKSCEADDLTCSPDSPGGIVPRYWGMGLAWYLPTNILPRDSASGAPP